MQKQAMRSHIPSLTSTEDDTAINTEACSLVLHFSLFLLSVPSLTSYRLFGMQMAVQPIQFSPVAIRARFPSGQVKSMLTAKKSNLFKRSSTLLCERLILSKESCRARKQHREIDAFGLKECIFRRYHTIPCPARARRSFQARCIHTYMPFGRSI